MPSYETLEEQLVRLSRGRFEDIKQVGEGSYATVFKAHDVHLGKNVAVKTCYKHDLRSMDHLKKELAIFGKLRHPNIVSYEGSLEFDNIFCVIVELMKTNLQERIDSFLGSSSGIRYGAEKAVTDIIDASQGVAALHELGIVHRDLHPGNILYTAEDIVKISDFGLVAQIPHDTDTARGVLPYMAPESFPSQAEGIAHATAASDVYSLGANLLHLLIGMRPFSIERTDETIRQKNNARYIDDLLAHHHAEIPPLLIPVITKSLALRMENRYQSASEFGSALLDVRKQMYPTAAELEGRRKELGSARKERLLHELAGEKRQLERELASKEADIARYAGQANETASLQQTIQRLNRELRKKDEQLQKAQQERPVYAGPSDPAIQLSSMHTPSTIVHPATAAGTIATPSDIQRFISQLDTHTLCYRQYGGSGVTEIYVMIAKDGKRDAIIEDVEKTFNLTVPATGNQWVIEREMLRKGNLLDVTSFYRKANQRRLTNIVGDTHARRLTSTEVYELNKLRDPDDKVQQSVLHDSGKISTRRTDSSFIYPLFDTPSSAVNSIDSILAVSRARPPPTPPTALLPIPIPPRSTKLEACETPPTQHVVTHPVKQYRDILNVPFTVHYATGRMFNNNPALCTNVYYEMPHDFVLSDILVKIKDAFGYKDNQWHLWLKRLRLNNEHVWSNIGLVPKGTRIDVTEEIRFVYGRDAKEASQYVAKQRRNNFVAEMPLHGITQKVWDAIKLARSWNIPTELAIISLTLTAVIGSTGAYRYETGRFPFMEQRAAYHEGTIEQDHKPTTAPTATPRQDAKKLVAASLSHTLSPLHTPTPLHTPSPPPTPTPQPTPNLRYQRNQEYATKYRQLLGELEPIVKGNMPTNTCAPVRSLVAEIERSNPTPEMQAIAENLKNLEYHVTRYEPAHKSKLSNLKVFRFIGFLPRYEEVPPTLFVHTVRPFDGAFGTSTHPARLGDSTETKVEVVIRPVQRPQNLNEPARPNNCFFDPAAQNYKCGELAR